MLLQFRIAEIVLIGWRFFWHPETFVGPRAEINAFATRTAKRAIDVLRAVQAGASAGGALHLFGLDQGLVHLKLSSHASISPFNLSLHLRRKVSSQKVCPLCWQ